MISIDRWNLKRVPWLLETLSLLEITVIPWVWGGEEVGCVGLPWRGSWLGFATEGRLGQQQEQQQRQSVCLLSAHAFARLMSPWLMVLLPREACLVVSWELFPYVLHWFSIALEAAV